MQKRLVLCRYHDAGEAPGTVLVGVGHLVNKPDKEDVRNRLWPHWGSLVLILEGEGIFTQGRMSQHVAAGDLLIVLPGVRHGYVRRQECIWSEYHIILQRDACADLDASGLIERDRPVLHLGLTSPVAAAMRELVSAFLRDADLPPQTALAAVVRILAAATGSRTRHGGAVTSFACEACRRLAEDLDRTCDLPAVASGLGMGYERFRKRFTEELGLPPYRYRLWCIIQESQRRLSTTRDPIKAIARQLGFSSSNHFNKRFRQLVGTTPAVWRRRGSAVGLP